MYRLCDIYVVCDIYWPNLTNQKITGQFLAGQKGSPDFSMKVYYQKNRSANVEKILDPALFQL